MRHLVRIIGIVSIAFGCAVLLFILLVRLLSPATVLSPVPQENPAEGQELKVTP